MRKVSILSLLLAAFLMAVSFTACSTSSSSNEDNGTKTSSKAKKTEYKATESSLIYTAVFETDGTFYVDVAMNSYKMGHEYEGTYTGDASKDGKITVTIHKYMFGTELIDYNGPNPTREIEITDGKFTLDYLEYTRQ